MPSVEELICALLRGDGPVWPTEAGEQYVSHLIERASYHGVLPLMHDRFQRSPAATAGWPAAVLHAAREAVLAHAMWELRHRDLLSRVLAQLAVIDVHPVLFKGTALAYGLYAEGALRTRGDTDFIISPGTLKQVEGVLKELSFDRKLGMDGEFVSYQASYTHASPMVGSHSLDVHWRINNAEVLARLFTHEELLRRSVPLPQLSPHALSAEPVDALLIACMHRATHKANPYYSDGVAYYSGDRLIWLYDIHLLMCSMTAAQCDEFLKRADEKGLRAVCLEGIERTCAFFHTVGQVDLLTALRRAGPVEAPALYLSGGRWRQHWMDFVVLGNARNRVRFMLETVFPSPAYLRAKYQHTRAGQSRLAWLYLRRAWEGLAKRLQVRRSQT